MKTVSLLAIAGALSLSGCSGGANPGPLTDEAEAAESSLTEAYYARAAALDRFKIASAELAAERSNDPAVKAFAEEMIAEHQALLDTLEVRVQEAGLSLSPVMLSAEQEAELASLSALTGEEFDLAFLEQQLAAHSAAAAHHRSHVDEAEHDAIAAHADASAERLLGHIEDAQALAQPGG